MPIPSFQEFMHPVLNLHADEKEHTTKEISQVVSQLPCYDFTDADWQQKTTQGQTLIYNRIAWAKSYLTNAKLLYSPKKGLSVLTERGKKALFSKEPINIKYLSQFEEFTIHKGKQTQNNAMSNFSQTPILTEEIDPIEHITQIAKVLNTTLAQELLETIKNSTPQFFERLVIDLMLALGYGGSHEEAGQTTRYSKDGGIDGIIKEDNLGLEMIYLQAKRYTDKSVGAPEVQSFVGALAKHHAKKGVFITTSKFSKDALDYVSHIGERIILIDGILLTELMIRHNVGVSIDQSFHVKSINSDYFEES